MCAMLSPPSLDDRDDRRLRPNDQFDPYFLACAAGFSRRSIMVKIRMTSYYGWFRRQGTLDIAAFRL